MENELKGSVSSNARDREQRAQIDMDHLLGETFSYRRKIRRRRYRRSSKSEERKRDKCVKICAKE